MAEELTRFFTFSRAVPNASSRVYYSAARIMVPFRVVSLQPNFAINTQRLLQLWPMVAPSDVPRTVLPDVFADGCTWMLEGDGFIVGDGQEGERRVPVLRDFPAGYFVGVRAVNADAVNPHTLDLAIEVMELAP